MMLGKESTKLNGILDIVKDKVFYTLSDKLVKATDEHPRYYQRFLSSFDLEGKLIATKRIESFAEQHQIIFTDKYIYLLLIQAYIYPEYDGIILYCLNKSTLEGKMVLKVRLNEIKLESQFNFFQSENYIYLYRNDKLMYKKVI